MITISSSAGFFFFDYYFFFFVCWFIGVVRIGPLPPPTGREGGSQSPPLPLKKRKDLEIVTYQSTLYF